MNTLPRKAIEPEDVADVVAFLASGASRAMTGSQVRVDLGTLNR
jgi:enoyl-[acyl-carrier-protein] reductase (NADH)